jgi:hydroxymethylpyrimidine pyrophosphatase-like HAD family hydrolase
LRDDGVIDPQDAAAIARARAAGIAVTLATGRWPQLTMPFARLLALDTPLICGDGALRVDPRTGQIDHLVPLPVGLRAPLVQLAAEAELPLLGVTPEHVLGLPRDRELAAQLLGFGASFSTLTAATELAAPELPLLSGFVLGGQAAITALTASAAQPLRDSALDAFALGGAVWALRVRAAGVDKQPAVATLAAARDLGADQCGAVGDWYNDLGLLAWAGFSFAMGHAPEEVVRAARHHLRATARNGGGVAEAIDLLLR